MSQIDTLIGEAVHRAMWRRRLQQIEVAPRVGMTQSALSKKIRGQRPWSVEEVYRIAAAIGVDPSELLIIELTELEPDVAVGGSPETERFPALGVGSLELRRGRPVRAADLLRERLARRRLRAAA
jgi:transcriptional regulator with XRE-family HTH domain